MKKPMFYLMSLLLLVTTLNAFGQEKKEAYEIPAKYVTLLLVDDPNSPMKLETPLVLKYRDGDLENAYTIRNGSEKAVKSMIIKRLDWFLTEEATKAIDSGIGYSFAPLESFSTLGDEPNIKLINFEEKDAERFGLNETPGKVYIAMVTRVLYTDGTTYDARDKFMELEKFIRELGINSKLTPEEIKSKKEKLTDFTRNFMK